MITGLIKGHRLKNRAKQLFSNQQDVNGVGQIVDMSLADKKFILIQKRSEIVKLCEVIKKNKPKIILEIGTSGGGTFRLFSHFSDDYAKICTIDIDNGSVRSKAYKELAKPTQDVNILQGGSYSSQTVKAVESWLDGDQLDFLFIDGDHLYDGVSKDYKLYSPFVKKGGLIGFHDIQDDEKSLAGDYENSNVGGVPQLWREIKINDKPFYEFIDSPDQEGYGIGLLVNE